EGAAQLDGAVIRDPELAGLEAELGVLPGVEELGREEVALQLLVGDPDAADVDRALQAWALATGQTCRVGLEVAAKGGDARVLDREGDGGVDGVDLVRSRWDRLGDRLYAHLGLAFLVV